MATRRFIGWAICGIWALAGCFSAKQDYPSGELACSRDRQCPAGYVCALSPTRGDDRCYAIGDQPDGGGDAGAGADGGCVDNARRCMPDGVTPEKCVGGQWQPLGACATACAEGDCASCVPGTPRCSTANRPQKCNAAGTGAGDAQSFIVALSHDLEVEDLAARQRAEAEAAAARQRADQEAARHRKAEADAAAAARARTDRPPIP